MVFLQPGFGFPKVSPKPRACIECSIEHWWGEQNLFFEGTLLVELGKARNTPEYRSSDCVFAAKVWVSHGLAKATSMHCVFY
jgi:hypothetical protein